MSEGELEGVDYAFPPRPDIGQLVAAGKRFACRYGGPGTLDKQLDPDEARALSAAGIAIVANAEGSTAGLLSGASAGADWATRAEARFKACGMPPGRPIYLSIDFDVNTLQWPLILAALRAAANVLGGAHRVGVYGGRRAIEWARRDGAAAWFWQTYAWSSGIWVPGNHIEQYKNRVQLAGADCDLNRAMQSDFGQWTVGGSDVALRDDPDGKWLFPRVESLKTMKPIAEGPEKGQEMGIVVQVKQIAADVAALNARPPVQSAPVDAATLKAVLLDPAVLAAIAKAVTNEIGS